MLRCWAVTQTRTINRALSRRFNNTGQSLMASGGVPNTNRILRMARHRLDDFIEGSRHGGPTVILFDQAAGRAAQLRPPFRTAQELGQLPREIGGIVRQ